MQQINCSLTIVRDKLSVAAQNTTTEKTSHANLMKVIAISQVESLEMCENL